MAISAPKAVITPVVVDLGKTKKSRIKDLKRGQGRLVHEVVDAVNQVRANFGAEAENKEFVPVVLIYKKKPSRRNPFGM